MNRQPASKKLHRLLTSVRAAWPDFDRPGVLAVVAVSGGPDSVALLHGLRQILLETDHVLHKRLVVAHFNHGWRGAESDRDQQFVADLARGWQLPFEIGRADHLAKSPNANPVSDSEESARSERYNFLHQVLKQRGARCLLAAHTCDDQVETILHRIVRGTGLQGLAGMARCRPFRGDFALVRPLLDVDRAAVLDYLAGEEQPYRQDSTNQNTKYTRNRIRSELIPQLQRDYNPALPAALLRLSQTADAALAALQPLIAEAELAVEPTPDGWQIDCERLRETADFVVLEVLRNLWRRSKLPQQSMDQRHWSSLLHLIRQPAAAGLTLPAGIRARREGEFVSICVPPAIGD